VQTKGTVKVSLGGKNSSSNNNKLFKEEMEHYRQIKPGNWGVGLDCEVNLNDFELLVKTMKTETQEPCQTELIINVTDKIGPIFLNSLKEKYLEKSDYLSDQYRKTRIGKSAEFAQRFAHSLFKLSTTTNNRDYVTFDNLGYENAMLIVRGGSKMYKGSRTRLFRILHPIEINLKKILRYSENYQYSTINNEDYVLSPWMQIDNSILKDTHSQYHRLYFDFFSKFTRSNRDFFDSKNFDFLPYFLAFHQRRKTEVALHNLRYFIVNPMGKFSTLNGIIKTFVFFNYTPFDYLLKKQIVKHFKSFALEMLKNQETKSLNTILSGQRIKHIITQEIMESKNDLTSMIYMTYTMTKAPVTKSIEQANNLLPILEDVRNYNENHGDVNKMDDKTLRMNVKDFKISDYDDDFKYDPTFCQYLGRKCELYLKRKITKSTISKYWEDSILRPIQEVANSSGMRGYNKENFFNMKGYKVVYDFIYENFIKGRKMDEKFANLKY
jgi:hypothetical protein